MNLETLKKLYEHKQELYKEISFYEYGKGYYEGQIDLLRVLIDYKEMEESSE